MFRSRTMFALFVQNVSNACLMEQYLGTVLKLITQGIVFELKSGNHINFCFLISAWINFYFFDCFWQAFDSLFKKLCNWRLYLKEEKKSTTVTSSTDDHQSGQVDSDSDINSNIDNSSLMSTLTTSISVEQNSKLKYGKGGGGLITIVVLQGSESLYVSPYLLLLLDLFY